jgi:diguanylate cyclase (GGDEF)-like protein
MRDSLLLSHGKNFAWLRNIDWSRRSAKDAIVIGGAAILTVVALAGSQFSDNFLIFLQRHDDWYLDDMIMASFVVNIGLVIFAFRRLRELSSEIGARGNAERESHRLAHHDPLTGLADRRLFDQTLEETLQCLDPHGRAALLMLDLDGFKGVNDTHGHVAGDRALLAVSKMLAAQLRDATLARLGGDEFAIVVPHIESRDAVAALAYRIVAGFSEPFRLGGVSASVSLGVSIGIVVAPDDGVNPDLLARRADLAMYRAKAEGRSLVCFYDSDMEVFAERKARIETDLRRAVEADTFVPYYQPLVSLNGNQIIGFESLARWGGTGEPLLPDQFIPLAEETGLILQLGDQLLRKSCIDARTWPDDLFLTFNISGVQLCDSGLGLRILSILAQTGFNPKRLELEITETALVKSTDVAREVIDHLRAAGVSIALDDFGTGYATLSQLMSLHFDKIKIDRSFVQRLGKDPESLVIVRAIVGIANGFGLCTVGEGVESEEQRICLHDNGCVEGQGYLFSKAIPASEVGVFLNSHRGTSRAA